MDVPFFVWALTIAAIVGMLIFDFVGHVRTPHAPTLRESAIWSAVYVGLAVVFGLLVLWFSGAEYAGEYFAGYVTEKSLSVDNLFVFVLIMAAFAVPRALQQKVLLFGITFALALRTVFILVGAAAIENFSWVFYLFGAILIYTAWVQARSGGHSGDEDYQENAVLRLARRVLPTTEEYHSDRMTVTVDGKRFITPLAIALIAIGTRGRHLRRRLDPGDLRPDPGDLPGVRRQRVLAARPAAAVLPHRRAARPPRLPGLRAGRDPRLHRRQARDPRAAHQRTAVHQRRRARDRDPGDLHRRSRSP